MIGEAEKSSLNRWILGNASSLPHVWAEVLYVRTPELRFCSRKNFLIIKVIMINENNLNIFNSIILEGMEGKWEPVREPKRHQP